MEVVVVDCARNIVDFAFELSVSEYGSTRLVDSLTEGKNLPSLLPAHTFSCEMGVRSFSSSLEKREEI